MVRGFVVGQTLSGPDKHGDKFMFDPRYQLATAFHWAPCTQGHTNSHGGKSYCDSTRGGAAVRQTVLTFSREQAQA